MKQEEKIRLESECMAIGGCVLSRDRKHPILDVIAALPLSTVGVRKAVMTMDIRGSHVEFIGLDGATLAEGRDDHPLRACLIGVFNLQAAMNGRSENAARHADRESAAKSEIARMLGATLGESLTPSK